MSDYLKKIQTLEGSFDTPSATYMKTDEKLGTSAETNGTIIEEKEQNVPVITKSREETSIEFIPFGAENDPEYMIPKVVSVKKYVLKK